MSSCITCVHARQVADTSRQDVVGCALLGREEMPLEAVRNSSIYQGWVYEGRRPGQNPEKPVLGQGILANGKYIVEATGTCRHHKEAEYHYTEVSK